MESILSFITNETRHTHTHIDNSFLSLPCEAREEVEILIAFAGKWWENDDIPRPSPLSPPTPLAPEG